MPRILAVDDEPLNLMILAEILSGTGHQVDQASDGEDAWEMLQQTTYDLVVLDRLMPRMDGLSLLKKLKADPHLSTIPVIMQTAAASQSQILEGLEAGAYHYLIKPYAPTVLNAMVTAVLDDVHERSNLREISANLSNTLTLMTGAVFSFRTLEDARALAAALSGLCADTGAAGFGLLELLINAVEHGNLGITYQEKSALRQTGDWEAEVAHRLTLTPWRDRSAQVELTQKQSEIEFIIRDEGSGFDWTRYLHFDPERAFDLNGRGVAMANTLGFQFLEYQGCGNTVVVRASRRQ
jgi:DNA-binding response OmpR family regulator